MNCDLMAIGVHPDDLEIGMGGLIIHAARQGAKIVMVDLTLGEMSTNGTPEIRRKESLMAASLMGVKDRLNLGMKDRGLTLDEVAVKTLVKLIRTYKPRQLFYPYIHDRHPDHGKGAALVREAIWSAGLIKFEVDDLKPYRPKEVFMYFINDVSEINTTYDISEVMSIKIEALACHQSQFSKEGKFQTTYLNDGFLDVVQARDRYFGYLAGTKFAECFAALTLPKMSLSLSPQFDDSQTAAADLAIDAPSSFKVQQDKD